MFVGERHHRADAAGAGFGLLRDAGGDLDGFAEMQLLAVGEQLDRLFFSRVLVRQQPGNHLRPEPGKRFARGALGRELPFPE